MPKLTLLLLLCGSIGSATTIATAIADCGLNSSGSSTDASCSSLSRAFSASAHVETYSVSVTSDGPYFLSPADFPADGIWHKDVTLPEPGAAARYETDVFLTVFGGTGPAVAIVKYKYALSNLDFAPNGSVMAFVNGKETFYRDLSGSAVGTDAFIPVVYGEPTLLHMSFYAGVGPGAINPTKSFSLSASLSIDSITAQVSCAGPPCTPATTQYSLVAVPEPQYAGFVGVALGCGCYFKRSRFNHSRAI